MAAKIVCVVPSIRPERMKVFRDAWDPLFRKHGVKLVTVWDGERPALAIDGQAHRVLSEHLVPAAEQDLFARGTDAVRNFGFVWATREGADYVLTLDDDLVPPDGCDPIAGHLAVLRRKVPLSWMNTADGNDLYLRGVPYAVRTEAPVHLSHGVWVEVPDFDAPTQLLLSGGQAGVPRVLSYYRGPVPTGVLFPLCGMNVMVTAEALPLLYYAPMGPDCGFPELNRFADIWMGVALKRAFDARGWACYTGASTVVHARASDVFKNLAQEAEGLRLNERWWREGDGVHPYFPEYARKRERYRGLIESIQAARGTVG